MQEEVLQKHAPSQASCPVSSWEVIEKPPPFGNPQKKLRLRVTYAGGKIRVLAPSFTHRDHLDRYVARFHLNFAGKEIIAALGPNADA